MIASMFDYVFHILACAPFLRLTRKSTIKFWAFSLTRFLNVNETNVIDIQDNCHCHLFKMSLTFFPVSMTFTSNVNDNFLNGNDIVWSVNDIRKNCWHSSLKMDFPQFLYNSIIVIFTDDNYFTIPFNKKFFQESKQSYTIKILIYVLPSKFY